MSLLKSQITSTSRISCHCISSFPVYVSIYHVVPLLFYALTVSHFCLQRLQLSGAYHSPPLSRVVLSCQQSINLVVNLAINAADTRRNLYLHYKPVAPRARDGGTYNLRGIRFGKAESPPHAILSVRLVPCLQELFEHHFSYLRGEVHQGCLVSRLVPNCNADTFSFLASSLLKTWSRLRTRHK